MGIAGETSLWIMTIEVGREHETRRGDTLRSTVTPERGHAASRDERQRGLAGLRTGQGCEAGQEVVNDHTAIIRKQDSGSSYPPPNPVPLDFPHRRVADMPIRVKIMLVARELSCPQSMPPARSRLTDRTPLVLPACSWSA